MPTLRLSTLLILLLTLDLCAQQGTPDRPRDAEAFTSVTYMSPGDSLDFAEFQERHMSNGGSNLLSRSKGYRMAWHIHVEGSDCRVERGDGRTLKEFLADPPPSYTKPMGYGPWCVEVMSGPTKRSDQHDRCYFEGP